MHYLPVIGIALTLMLSCQCQRQYQQKNPEYVQEEAYNLQRTPPPPQILSHKQALNHDGNFKYVFTSENGLAQGENIAPDGSRNGAYSYIDPNGKKISVKYTAGKEGFRILEADHLPKAPQPIAPLPVPVQQPAYQPQYTANQPQYTVRQPQYNLNQQEDDGQYRPEIYERPQQQQILQSPSHIRSSYPVPLTATPAPSSNALQEKDYFDEPGKPHSFGSGYIFEFGG